MKVELTEKALRGINTIGCKGTQTKMLPVYVGTVKDLISQK